MKHYGRFGLVAVAMGCALALSGCTSMIGALASASDPPKAAQPGTYADKTTLDEKAGIAVEVAFQAAALLSAETANSGLIDGAPALRIKAAKDVARDATHKARAAYDAGNARSYRDLEKVATAAISEFIAVIIRKGESP